MTKAWDRRYGGIGDELFSTFVQTKDNGYIIAGSSRSENNGDKSQASYGQSSDCWVVKTDAGGNKVWDKRFGGYSTDGVGNIKQTPDGGYILGGHVGGGIGGDISYSSRGDLDYWLLKIDSAGNKLWDGRYGGPGEDVFIAFDITADNGFIICGFSNSGIGGDKSQPNWDSTQWLHDGWVVKVDSLGNKEWDKRFGSWDNDDLWSVFQTTDGGYMLAGTCRTGNSGNISEPSFGSDPSREDYWVVKLDSVGNKLWDKRYGGFNYENFDFMCPAGDGGFVLAGESWSGISGNKTVAEEGSWFLKIDSVGNIIWQRVFTPGPSSYQLQGLERTQDGGFIVSIATNGGMQGDKTEENLGSYQTWMLKLDSEGNKQWDKTIFSLKKNKGYAIETNDGCYAISTFTNSGVGGYKTQPNWDVNDSTFDYWMVQLCGYVGMENLPLTTETPMQVYPNPFTDDISISVQKENLSEATFTITNLQGQIVYTRHEDNLKDSYTKMLNLGNLPDGVYLIEIIVDGQSTIKKAVKQH